MNFKDTKIEIYTDRQHDRRGGTEEFRAGAMVWFWIGDEGGEKDYMMLTRRGDSYEDADRKLTLLLENMGFEGEIVTGFWTDVYTPREEWYEIQDARKALVRKLHEELEPLDDMLMDGNPSRAALDLAFSKFKNEEQYRGLKGIIGELEGLLYD